jgi:hypothetical protein
VVAVGDDQLKPEALDVRGGVRSTREAIQDGEERVGLTELARDLGPPPGHVDDPDRGGCRLLRPDEGRELLEPLVGDDGHSHVRLRRHGRIRGDFGPRVRQRVEQCRLPGIGETHDPDLQRHRACSG